MTPTEWNALAERCRDAKGADREIDGDISLAVGEAQDVFKDTPYVDREGARFVGRGMVFSAPYYTASLDAIVALVERELPGWIWTIYSKAEGPHPTPRATVVATDYRTQIGCNGQTPALALCAAFCLAMAAKGSAA